MKKTMVVTIGILLVCGTFCVSYGGQFAKVGTAGTQFLKIGAGARFVGLGGASVGLVDDASAIFWNPAGLVHVNNMSILTSHIEWLADIRYEAVALAKTLPGIGTFGISACFLTSGEMDITTYQNQEGTGETFSKTDMTVGISYAKYLTNKFSFGGNIKYVREDYGTTNALTGESEVASAIAFDVGAVYYTGLRSLRLGIAIQNFGPEMKIPGKYMDIIGFDSKTQEYVTEPEDSFRPYHMPLTFRVGLAMEVWKTSLSKITVVADLVHPPDNIEQVNIGGEYWFNDLLALRGGYIGGHDSAKFGAGGSIRLAVSQESDIGLHYSYSDFGILDMVHQISVVFNF